MGNSMLLRLPHSLRSSAVVWTKLTGAMIHLIDSAGQCGLSYTLRSPAKSVHKT